MPGAAQSAEVVLTTGEGLEFHEDPVAPTTFAVEADLVYLDNPVRETIDSYQQGKLIKRVLVSGIGVIDVQVSKGSLTLLGAGNRIVNLDTLGVVKSAKTVVIPDALQPSVKGKVGEPEIMAKRLDAVGDGYSVLFDNNIHVALDENIAIRKETLNITSSGFTIADGSGKVVKQIAVPNSPVGIEEIYRDSDSVYYLATDSYYSESEGNVYSKYVFGYDRENALIASYTLREAEHVVPNREVVVRDGQVYQLLITNDSAQVLRLSRDGG